MNLRLNLRQLVGYIAEPGEAGKNNLAAVLIASVVLGCMVIAGGLGLKSYTFILLGMVGVGWFKDLRFATLFLVVAVPLAKLVGAPSGPLVIQPSPVARFLLAGATGVIVCYLIDTTRRANSDAVVAAYQLAQLDDVASREQHLRAFTDALPMIMASFDCEERYRSNNRAYEIWFGPERRDVRGLSLRDVIGDCAYEVVRPYVREVLGGKTVKFEALVHYKDAGPRWVEATYLPDSDVNGTVRGFFSFVRDRTERVQADMELRLSERRYRALVEASTSFVWLADAHAQIVSPQGTLERYTGQVWPDYQGITIPAAVHPDDRTGLAEKWQAARSTFKPFSSIARIWDEPSLSWRHCETVAVPVKSDAGEVVEWIVTTTDVEDRIMAPLMAQLRVSDERTRLAESGGKLGSWEWDLGTGFVWSDGLARLYGLDPAELSSFEPFIERTHPEDRERITQAFRQAASEGRGIDAECRMVRPDEEVRWLRARASFLPPTSGVAARVVGITMDITESVRSREALQEALAGARETAEDLRHANAAKDDFLGMVSHELRTPLTIVKGNLDVLRRLQEQVDPQVRRQAVEDAGAEAVRLQWLIENMLILARLERGQHLELEPTLLSRIVQGVVEEQRHEQPERPINVRCPDEDTAILAHSDYVEQVVRNLVSNANKYSPPAAPIDITVKRVDGLAEVHVMDRGVGIALGEEDQIFEPFYRSDRTAARVGGMGLGLAVCRRVIEAQNGRLWAHPREGGGSDFGFALPA